MSQANITNEELQKASGTIQRILNYYNSKMVGQPFLGNAILISMMANGHILMESVPGLAKTTAAKVMTEAVGGSFSRVQCTPDLIPSDIIGTQIYNAKENIFETKIGPVYANFLLLDEINRSSAKTQSAMLEAMQEHAITIGGKKIDMPEVFVVIATQNPVEQEGTYVLSEAQLDRFLLKVNLNYPDRNAETEILNRVESGIFDFSEPVATIEEIMELQKLRKRVYIDNLVKQYIVDLVQATRYAERYIGPELAQYISMGASTRAAITFMETTKAVAVISGRGYVTPDDVKYLKYAVLGHRIGLNYAAMADGIKVEQIVDAIVGAVPTP
ncbi:MAG: MoxR family ATPase [Lachnospiraceae bacterium]|nr:MoxR family ATPase [Lachnospiraceae bacterium]